MKLIFETPINNLSMGNVGINLLLALWKKNVDVLFLPMGQPDISNFDLPEEFKQWLNNAGNRFLTEFDRNLWHVRNWHLAGSHQWVSNKRMLLSYHECDQITPPESNTIKNIDKVLFCGNYTQKVCEDIGLKVGSFNLGFDDRSFKKLNKTYFNDGRINHLLAAKIEKRKKTLEILSLWAQKFGKKSGEFYQPGEQQHYLNCQIVNPFYDIKIQEQQIAQVLNGIRYSNIQFFNFLPREQWNDLLNATDIDLTGLSGGESWNLIPFNISCLGKWSIVLNCTGMKSWATDSNSILVQPNGKVSCIDNIHFHQNSPFNTGNFYTFDNNEVLQAMDKAVKLAKTPNLEGEKLKDQFSYEKTIDSILKEIEN